MKIGFANDHAGYDLKERLKTWAIAEGHEVVDFGADDGLAAVDYPDLVSRAAAGTDWEYLVLICGSGLGMSMAANRYSGIRCALVTSTEHAKLARLHNDANAIALGQRLTDPLQAEYYLKTFLETPFLGLQHKRRVEKLTNHA